MKQIKSMTNAPKQNMQIALDDGSLVDFTMWYCDNQRGWFYSITYGNFSANNRRMVTSPNMLRQFRNVLPFGFACVTTDGQEPVFINDFSSGRASFFVLNSTDIQNIEDQLIL